MNVFKASQYLNQEEECHAIDIIEELVDESLNDKDTIKEGNMFRILLSLLYLVLGWNHSQH